MSGREWCLEGSGDLEGVVVSSGSDVMRGICLREVSSCLEGSDVKEGEGLGGNGVLEGVVSWRGWCLGGHGV